SCISKDQFVMPEPIVNNVLDTTVTTDTNQNIDTISSTITGGGTATDTVNQDTSSNIIVNTQTCSPDTVYFEQSILPLIVSNCAMSGCHDAKSQVEGYNYSNYAGIRRSVNISSPENSKLYRVLFDGGGEYDDDSKFGINNPTLHAGLDNHRMPPKPMDPLNDTQKSTILKWIKQGALNNSCTESANSGNCDLTNITYSTTILNIVNTYCLGCHNTNSGQNATLLNTYANVKAQVDNGKFLGTIQHSQGYIPMPSADTKLDPCNIEKIKTWINDGAPNN
ncbi:MAG: hypothetical protein RIR51_652, partial [Bacteroidota bacterium]